MPICTLVVIASRQTSRIDVNRLEKRLELHLTRELIQKQYWLIRILIKRMLIVRDPVNSIHVIDAVVHHMRLPNTRQAIKVVNLKILTITTANTRLLSLIHTIHITMTVQQLRMLQKHLIRS